MTHVIEFGVRNLRCLDRTLSLLFILRQDPLDLQSILQEAQNFGWFPTVINILVDSQKGVLKGEGGAKGSPRNGVRPVMNRTLLDPGTWSSIGTGVLVPAK